MLTATTISASISPIGPRASTEGGFPPFLPKQVEKVKDTFARNLASRIQRLPVQLSISNNCIMSSCVKPMIQDTATPLVLLHGFDSSCLEWRYTLPLLEQAGFETWAIDILGWGFSNLEKLPQCNVESKRDHLFQFWKTYIGRPMLLVGPSLGAAVAIDFAINHPEAVDKLIFIDASVYAEGTSKLPKFVAYAGVSVSVLKSLPLRIFATNIAFNSLDLDTCLDWTLIGRLHTLLPWWEDATVDFMNSGGYNVTAQIPKIMTKTLIIWGEEDQIIDSKLAVVRTFISFIITVSYSYVLMIELNNRLQSYIMQRLHCELPNAIIRQIPKCGHIPHVEKPDAVANLIKEFIQTNNNLPSFSKQEENVLIPQLE
ncbi:putative triacylglycerol lipase [Helianthus annuus]|nr:putative triacylglycerol lipase [Helianthus annuus]KAJ0675617.1 putative triacylglycerol lipase [Helianthus annuus]KAJ0678895.1 putative triacylglycerol lipase [Helianthus annuus]